MLKIILIKQIIIEKVVIIPIISNKLLEILLIDSFNICIKLI